MKPLVITLSLALLLLLPGVVVADGEPDNARLEELWKTGSLWQVGDNIKKVEEARKAIVAAGDAGLAFAFTKLNTTDGLEFRCLEAVFKGFGAKALPGLLERMAHEDVKVRRNVAAMLGVIDDKSAGPKMAAHLSGEKDLRCKVGHLQALARWKEPAALEPLIECTRVTQEQEVLAERLKVRVVPLLANYENDKAVSRLLELLEDPAFFIRDAARAALKSTQIGLERSAKLAATTTLKLPTGPEDSLLLRQLVDICIHSFDEKRLFVVLMCLEARSAGLRMVSAEALQVWVARVLADVRHAFADTDDKESQQSILNEAKKDAARLSKRVRELLERENDPGALLAMELALKKLIEMERRLG